MNQTVSAAETVFSAAHPDIKKSTSISSLILSVLLLAAGAALLFFSSKVDDSSSSSGPMLLVGGVALLATGGIRLLVGKKESHLHADRQYREKRIVLFRYGQPVPISGNARRESL